MKLILAIVTCMIWGMIFFILSSCGSPVQKVLTNKSYFTEVGKKWAELNPCTPSDTVLEFINGDSIIINNTDTITCMRVMHDTIITEKIVTKTVKLTNTIIKTVTDTRALRIANESINTLQGELVGSNSKIDELRKELIIRQKWLYLASLVLFILGVIIGLIIKYKL